MPDIHSATNAFVPPLTPGSCSSSIAPFQLPRPSAAFSPLINSSSAEANSAMLERLPRRPRDPTRLLHLLDDEPYVANRAMQQFCQLLERYRYAVPLSALREHHAQRMIVNELLQILI